MAGETKNTHDLKCISNFKQKFLEAVGRRLVYNYYSSAD